MTISGDAGDLGSWPAGILYTFYGANRSDYRMGTYEITNDQWDKFRASLGVPVAGTPSKGYDLSPSSTGMNVPTDSVSWYEAAQFVNWLNTSTGHHEAYKFTGTQGQWDYALATWSSAEAAGGTNIYRHKDAFYYLPTEEEWVKAAYWNGTTLQTYATIGDIVPTAGVDSNYDTAVLDSWDVGSGSEELNGTFDMIGNVWEWMESPFSAGDYITSADRSMRGGSYMTPAHGVASSYRIHMDAYDEHYGYGFRVASDVPEPATLSLLALGGLAVLRRRKK